MPGYPCCCTTPLGGFWDLYNTAFSPYLLDMNSFSLLGNVSSYSDSIISYNDPGSSTRSFFFDNGVIPTFLAPVSQKPDMWFIDQLSSMTGLSLPSQALTSIDRSINKSWSDKNAVSPYLVNNGVINLRSDTETVLQFNNIITTGTFITESNDILSTEFDSYLEVFSTLYTPYLSDSSYAEIVENDKRYRAERGFEGLGHDELIDIELPDFKITGAYGNTGPLRHSRNVTRYELIGNPVEVERFYDTFGIGDEYPGSSATYNTGTFRYELDQPYFTGVTNYIRHSLDLPTDLFTSSTTGYIDDYSGLPTTGTYVALYGYLNFDTFTIETGIHSTGTLPSYVNNVKNFMPNAEKMTPPLISSFTIDEGLLDNYRSNTNIEHERLLSKLNLVIKPDEIRFFMIGWNERTINNGPFYHIRKELNNEKDMNGTYLYFDDEGKLYNYKGYNVSSEELFVEPLTTYTIDNSGYYHIELYKEYPSVFLFAANTGSDIINDYPVMTGEPSCTNPGPSDPSDTSLHVAQCKSNYTDLYNTFTPASGYSQYDLHQERSLYIWPFNAQFNNLAVGGNQPIGYLGSSGDGFYLQEAKISFYERDFYTSVLNTNVQDKTWIQSLETSIMDQSRSDSIGLVSSGSNNIDGEAGVLLDFNYFPQNIISYDNLNVNLLSFKINTDSDFILSENKGQNQLYGFTTFQNKMSLGQDLNSLITDTGSLIHDFSPQGEFVTIVTDFLPQSKYIHYDITGETFYVSGVDDINLDSFHYADKLANLDTSGLENSNIRPCILSNTDPKSLVLVPHTNCWPELFQIGDSLSDVRDTTGISYDYYLSSRYEIESIDKFSRSGTTVLPFITGVGIIEDDISTLDTVDSYRSKNYAVPTADIYLGTTNIERPTGGLEANTGNITFTEGGFVSGDYDIQTTELWMYSIYLDVGSTIRNGNVFPYTGGPYVDHISPKFLDSFVCNRSPCITASGWVDYLGGADLTPGVDLDFSYRILGTGETSISPPSDSYVDYTRIEYETGKDFLENNWTQLSQGQARTYPYQYSNYGDNYALHWAETVNKDGVEFYSFAVNGNYIFQNISGAGVDELEFKVGPNNLVYILRGEISGINYNRYGDYVDGASDMTWIDYARNSANRPLDPPTLIAEPSISYTLKTTDLNGSDIFVFSTGSHTIPHIIGVTDEHFYVSRLGLTTLPDLFDINDSDILTDFVTESFYDGSDSFVDSYQVLYHYGEPRRENNLWKIDYNGAYFSTLYPYDAILNDSSLNINDPFPIKSISKAAFALDDSKELEINLDNTLITNNSQITETPVASDRSVFNFKTLDYTVNSHVWDGGSYISDYDFLSGNNWTPGSDVYIDINEIRLNTPSSGFTGTDVALYKNLPVEAGKTYVLQLQLSTDLGFGNNDAHTKPVEYLDFSVTHSGVVGSDGEQVQARSQYFASDDERFSFFDGVDTVASTLTNINRMKLVYTATEVSGTGYNPLIINFTSSEELTFNWNKDTEPRFMSMQAMTFHEAISGNIFPDIELQYPTITGYEVI